MTDAVDMGAHGDACDVVVPAYNAFEPLERCLRALERNTGGAHRLILVDDASTDPRVLPLLHAFASRRPGTVVLENAVNLGFVGAVNAALPRTRGDVVLLNADTAVTSGWLDALRRCRASAPRIGIVCPLSNNATLLSIAGLGALFGPGEQEAIAACVHRAGPASYPRIPTAVGFCMMVTRELLDAAGPLDIAYGRGYGEENDLSMRAHDLGFEIACCDDAYVHHEGEASFGTVEGIGEARERNRKLLERRWPAYRPGVAAWTKANPLRPAIERINAQCERERLPGRPRVLHVMHAFDTKGGVEGHTRTLIHELRDDVAFNVVVPNGPGGVWTDFMQERPAAHVRISRMNPELLTPGPRVLEFAADLRDPSVERAFMGLLAGGYDVVHVHTPLGWNTLRLTALARESGARVVLSVHDMGWMCAEYNMVTGPDDLACGRIVARGSDAGCLTCLRGKSHSRARGREGIAAYIDERLAMARQAIRDADAIICPSRYALGRFTAAFGDECAGKARVIEHGVADLPIAYGAPRGPGALRVAFVGRFTTRKGAHHFIAAAGGLRGQGFVFEAWGGIDERLRQAALGAGVALRDAYEVRDLPAHLEGVDLVVMPSTLDETFCLTLSEMHALGIPVAAARSGAMPERVRDGDNGFLFDVGDVDGMKRMLLRIRDDRSLLARAAQSLAAERPKTMTQNAREYLEAYRELARLPRRAAPALPRAEPAMDDFFPPRQRSCTPLGDDAYDQWLATQPEPRTPVVEPAAPFALLILPGAAGAAATEASLVPQRAFVRERIAHDDGASPASLNRAIAASTAEWVVVMQEGDTLAEHALEVLAREALAQPRAMLYSDHDARSLRGEPYDPAFKPDFSPELLRHQPYLAGLCAIRREGWLAMGGFRATGWQGVIDFALRLAHQGDAARVVHVRHILLHRLDANALALDEPPFRAWLKETVAQHLQRAGARPMLLEAAPGAAPMWAHQPAGTAQVSVFMRCAHEKADPAACLHGLMRRTAARVAEIFVDLDEARAAGLGALLARGGSNTPVRALAQRDGAALAEAFRRSASEWMVVVDARCRVFTAGWIERLQQGVPGRSTAGIVPDLIDAAGRRVAGWFVAGGGPWSIAGAAPPALGDDSLSATYASPREVTCFAPYLSLWRVETARSPVALRDIARAGRFDIAHLCLAVRDRGADLLARPFVAAQLGSDPAAAVAEPSPESVPEDVAWMRERWTGVLDDDPFFHPALALTAPRLAPAPRFGPVRAGRVKVCAFPFDRWASGEMRVRQPCAALAREGLADVIVMDTHESGRAPNLREWRRMEADTLLAHNFFHDYQLRALGEIARDGRALRVLGMDDLLSALPPGNPFAGTIYRDIAQRIARAVALCDRLIVSTPELADAYGGRAEVHVIPNALDPRAWAGLENRPRDGARPRIGWAGARQHVDDLRLIEPVVAATAGEVDWVFLGMCPPELRRFAAEAHEMVPIARYPATLASLGLDAGVAPLLDHPFNRAKSALKVLEYGVLGIPAIASAIGGYRHTPARLVPNDADAWIEAIREVAAGRAGARERGLTLRNWVLANGMLPSTLLAWRRALG